MILADVMQELADVADGIPGLTCYGWPTEEATPPAAWPIYPARMPVNAAFQRGTDRWQGGLWVAVGRVWDKATRDQLSRYTAGDGPESVIAAYFAHDWQTCAYARPVEWTFDAIQLAGVEMMAALLELDIAGPGATEG